MSVPRHVRQARSANRIANSRPRAVRRWGRLHARLYRLSRGRLLPRWFGAPVLVMETVGRRSGRRRSTPVLYLGDGGGLVVYAANAGAHRTPDWWLNLRDAGEATVVLGGERLAVRPRVLAGAERERAWSAFCEMYPQARTYPSLTDRPMPLVALEPVSANQDDGGRR
jgi:deazaflavin-dependent oxidoreductase (nitroreductase family)